MTDIEKADDFRGLKTGLARNVIFLLNTDSKTLHTEKNPGIPVP